MKKIVLVSLTAVMFAAVAEAAIDTMNRRASAGSVQDPGPDSGIDAGDRAQILGEYRGFFDTPAAAEAAANGNGGFAVGNPCFDRRRRR